MTKLFVKTPQKSFLYIFLFILIPLFFYSCTSDETDLSALDYASLESLELTKQLEISGSERYLPARMNGFFMTDEGHYLVADRQSPAIHQFDSNGNHLKQVARDGRGPGELSDWFQTSFDGTVLTASNNPGYTMTMFSPGTDGLYEHSKTLSHQYRGSFRGFRNRGDMNSFYVSENRSMQQLGVPDEFTSGFIHVVDVDQNSITVSDSLYSLQIHSPYIQMPDGGGISISYLPFRYTDSFVPLPEGRVLVGSPSDQSISILNSEFEVEHVLELRVVPREIADEEIEYHIGEHDRSTQQEMRELIKLHKPDFMDVKKDDADRFWLWTDDTSFGREYVVLSYEGDPLGRIQLPPHQELQMVKDNRMLVISQPENDAPAAVVYRLEGLEK